MSETQNDKNKPMDPTAREEARPSAIQTRPRDCYAATALIAEVQALYPDVDVVTFQPNGRSVNIAVAVYDDDEPDLQNLLALLGEEAHNVDDRIETVDRDTEAEPEEGGYSYVIFVNSPTLYDLKDSFGLASAHDVLTEEEDTEEPTKPGHYIFRSAVTGRVVKEHYARTHPDTTTREWVQDTEEEQ